MSPTTRDLPNIPNDDEQNNHQESVISRRTLIQGAGFAGTAALLGPVASSANQEASPVASPVASPESSPVASPVAVPASSALPPNVPPWMKEWGPLPSEYGSRSSFEDGVVRDPSSTSSRSPLADLRGIITPNSLFYERHHAGVPQIDPSEHRLMVHGLVDHPTLFTVEDLKRFPSTSVIHFLECSGNSGSEYKEETMRDTVQKSHGLVSATEWVGVPLKTVLAEVGLQPGGTWLLCEGADAAAMTRSIPTEKAMDDALLVYGQNGEALRPEQGYPVRLILPGWEGNSNIKWIRRIKVGQEPWMTREESSKYTDLMPNGIARQFTWVMEAKSVITFPSGGQTIPGKGFWEIRGIAWSGRGKIERVEVSVDGGKSWNDAELQEPVLPICLTRFRYPWAWEGQTAVLQSRCIDETGYVQPSIPELVAARGLNSVYHMNGIKPWSVDENGEVTSVY